VFVWRRGGTEQEIQMRRRSHDGRLSAIKTVRVLDDGGSSPQVAVDGSGDADMVWIEFDDGSDDLVIAKGHSRLTGFGQAQTLSAPLQSAQTPVVAVDKDGDATFAWARFDGSYDRVQGAAGTL
jgi:hypothetical protein